MQDGWMMCEHETLFHFVSYPIANHDGKLCINHPDVSKHAYQITHELKIFDYALGEPAPTTPLPW
jgi:hypothetical protein